jgi:hypothetical protein
MLPKTQTLCVHKAVLTKQRSEASKPMFSPHASKIEPVQINFKPVCHFFSRIRQSYWLILKLNLAEEMKWHTSVDLLAHACVPNLDISYFLSSTCFLH